MVGCLVYRPDSHPYRVKIAVSHRYSKFYLMMGTKLPEICREVEMNIPRRSVILFGFI